MRRGFALRTMAGTDGRGFRRSYTVTMHGNDARVCGSGRGCRRSYTVTMHGNDARVCAFGRGCRRSCTVTMHGDDARSARRRRGQLAGHVWFARQLALMASRMG